MSATKDQNKYKKHELRDHIYELPDTYIGSIENTAITTYIYDDETSGMIKKEINYVPGLYKIFDEVLVNAIDQSTRLLSEVDSGKKGVKPVKNIHINIDKDTGVIKVS
jgi:DNA gyrase/topoisomerase IV subunit B